MLSLCWTSIHITRGIRHFSMRYHYQSTLPGHCYYSCATIVIQYDYDLSPKNNMIIIYFNICGGCFSHHTSINIGGPFIHPSFHLYFGDTFCLSSFPFRQYIKSAVIIYHIFTFQRHAFSSSFSFHGYAQSLVIIFIYSKSLKIKLFK